MTNDEVLVAVDVLLERGYIVEELTKYYRVMQPNGGKYSFGALGFISKDGWVYKVKNFKCPDLRGCSILVSESDGGALETMFGKKVLTLNETAGYFITRKMRKELNAECKKIRANRVYSEEYYLST